MVKDEYRQLLADLSHHLLHHGMEYRPQTNRYLSLSHASEYLKLHRPLTSCSVPISV